MNFPTKIVLPLFACAALVLLTACDSEPQVSLEEQAAEIAALYPEAQSNRSGLHYRVLEEGEGETPSVGDTAVVHYTGALLDGTEFDSSAARNRPFSFTVGKGQVIAGWDEAVLSMRKGEKRTLIIPAELAYGKRGVGPIPPNAILVFDVELLDFE